MNLDSQDKFEPKIGMNFDSLDEAWKFWVEYGGKTGFGVRKHYFNKNKKTGLITSYVYVCCKEGVRKPDKRDSLPLNPRLETRTNCKVRMRIKHLDGKYIVEEFIEDHNHPLHLPETVHMLPSQRNIIEAQAYQIDLAEDAGLKQKSTFQLMSRQTGGREGLGYTKIDAKNYLRSKRQRSMVYGEVGCLMRYFQNQLSKNSSFYHANQMDIEEQIANVFWADARMLIDYEYFGDVVSLDTTHCTNRAHRPLFSGLNHHRGVVIFGASFLYDETSESFKWLFETFLEAHKQKRPLTIFTDQAQAMAKALHEAMSETFHGLCTWHLMQNGIKHLGNLMKDGSNFLSDFKRCMYGIDDEIKFEEAWRALLEQFNVQENTWLQSTYDLKKKWAISYMKHAYTLGIRSTQLSENVNSDIKSCMNPHLDIDQFFKHFEQILEDKRYDELRSEFDTRQKLLRLKLKSSPMLRQLSEIYTPTIFHIFQTEFDLFAAAYIKHRNEAQAIHEYIVGLIDEEGEWRVTFDPSTTMISCSCRKFEMVGLLCCHAVKVYDVLDVKVLPKHYILKRWTREARSGVVYNYIGNEVEEDPELQSTERYRKLCMMLIRLATEASVHQSTFSLVQTAVHDLSKQVMEMRLIEESQDINDNIRSTSKSSFTPQAKGFKKRFGLKNSRRMKSWGIKAHNMLSASCSAPPVPQRSLQTIGSQINFTELLTAPFDHHQYSLESMYFNEDASNKLP